MNGIPEVTIESKTAGFRFIDRSAKEWLNRKLNIVGTSAAALDTFDPKVFATQPESLGRYQRKRCFGWIQIDIDVWQINATPHADGRQRLSVYQSKECGF